MKADARYLNRPPEFWANVRLISERGGYTEPADGHFVVKTKKGEKRKRNSRVKISTLDDMVKVLKKLGLNTESVADASGKPTTMGGDLLGYFAHRAKRLNEEVEPNLMNAEEAKKLFAAKRNSLSPTCPLPMNKQKREKRNHAFLTGLVNMLVEANIKGARCNYDPLELTTVTRNGMPLRTLSRRVDGAFPSPIDPIAIWEIKEYYYTTTFGSRVADGVYESLLDGMELQELKSAAGVNIKHYLIVDSHFTWWCCGKPYLCRLFDMLHMGYVDELIFGKEVVARLPDLARQWTQALSERQ